MNIIYTLLIIFTLFLIYKRKFDFLSIGVVGLIIYNFPALIGDVYIPKANGYYYFSKLSNKTYVMIIIQIIILIISIVKYDKKRKRKRKKERKRKRKKENFIFKVILLLSIILMLFELRNTGSSLASGNKKLVHQNLTALYGISVWSSLVVFSYSLRKNENKLKILSGMIIIINLFLGSRAYISTLIVLFFLEKQKKIKKIIRNNIKLFFKGSFMVTFIFLYKSFYKDILSFNFLEILNKIKHFPNLLKNMKIEEPTIVLSIYNKILVDNFTLPIRDSLMRIFSIIPFVNNFFNSKYNLRMSGIMKNEIFKTTYGLANSFWGESYAMFGIFGIIIFTLIWIKILILGNECLKSNKSKSFFILPIISYLSFYIHRLDVLQVVGAIKSMMVVYLAYFCLKTFVNEIKN